ncbi:hypothetical protein SLA2020_363800 [Shorea laevis]
MAATNLKKQLKHFITSLQDQGILDVFFNQLQQLNSKQNPPLLLELISIFCQDAEISIAEMTHHLNSAVVDYDKVIAWVHKLKGGSASIGGKQVAAACRELRLACDDKHQERCVAALQKTKEAFSILRDSLNTISDLERAILETEGRRS